MHTNIFRYNFDIYFFNSLPINIYKDEKPKSIITYVRIFNILSNTRTKNIIFIRRRLQAVI